MHGFVIPPHRALGTVSACSTNLRSKWDGVSHRKPRIPKMAAFCPGRGPSWVFPLMMGTLGCFQRLTSYLSYFAFYVHPILAESGAVNHCIFISLLNSENFLCEMQSNFRRSHRKLLSPCSFVTSNRCLSAKSPHPRWSSLT